MRKGSEKKEEEEEGGEERHHPPPFLSLSREGKEKKEKEENRERTMFKEEAEGVCVLVAIDAASIPLLPTIPPTVAVASPSLDDPNDTARTEDDMEVSSASALHRHRPRSASPEQLFFSSTNGARSSSSSPTVSVSSLAVSQKIEEKEEEERKKEANENEEQEEGAEEKQIRLRLEKNVPLPTVVDEAHLLSFAKEVQQRFNEMLHHCSGVQKRNRELTYQVKALMQFKEAVMRELK